MKITNPSTGKIIKTIKESSKKSILEKFTMARHAQTTWKTVSLKKRLSCIKNFSDALEANSTTLAEVLTNEMGKPLWQSHNEIKGAQVRIKFFLENSEKFLADEWQISDGATHEKISYEPLGVIANISAWNYPYLVGINVFVPALIAGNAVLYKPSEYASLTGLEIEKMMRKSGIPENIFAAVIGGKNAGEALLSLPMDGYFFTGSYRTGKYIAEKVSAKLVPCQLELGGNDPLYATEDIEIKKVAAAAAEGVFYNNGQSCCAVKRIYVNRAVYNDFVKEFVEELKKWKVGAPMEEGVMIGPVSRKEHLTYLDDLVRDAIKKGATQIPIYTDDALQGVKKQGFFFPPTVFLNVNHSMRLMKEEPFGPVIGIQRVKDDAEAVRLMQDTEYGLTASVYTREQNRAEKILSLMNTGTAYWNCCDRVSPYLPWSGRKHSGLGATLSHLGIRAFAKPKGWHLRVP